MFATLLRITTTFVCRLGSHLVRFLTFAPADVFPQHKTFKMTCFWSCFCTFLALKPCVFTYIHHMCIIKQSCPIPLTGSWPLTMWTRPWCTPARMSWGSSMSTSPGSWVEHEPCRSRPLRKPGRSSQTITSMWPGWLPASSKAVKKLCEAMSSNGNATQDGAVLGKREIRIIFD